MLDVMAKMLAKQVDAVDRTRVTMEKLATVAANGRRIRPRIRCKWTLRRRPGPLPSHPRFAPLATKGRLENMDKEIIDERF
jgi:hypothetical protein